MADLFGWAEASAPAAPLPPPAPQPAPIPAAPEPVVPTTQDPAAPETLLRQVHSAVRFGQLVLAPEASPAARRMFEVWQARADAALRDDAYWPRTSPTPAQLADPAFAAIYDAIWHWTVVTPGQVGMSWASAEHVKAILARLRSRGLLVEATNG